MVIKELKLDPDDLVYIGAQDGSSFYYIGLYDDIPERYRDMDVAETYPHTIDYEGLTILTAGGTPTITRPKPTKEDPEGTETVSVPTRSSWREFNPSVPPYPFNHDMNPDGVLMLYQAIVRDTANDYRLGLRITIKEQSKKLGTLTSEELRGCIDRYHMKADGKFPFLENGRGEYIMRMIEDTEYVSNIYADELSRIKDYKDRQRLIVDKIKKLHIERAKSKAKARYATIKGRSVWHG